MRVSEFYNLGRKQPTLDFVDVDVFGDTLVYVDPTAIRTLPSEWGSDCVALLQSYFEEILAAIQAGDDQRAHSLLAALSEPNDARLGQSQQEPHGSGISWVLAEDILNELKESRAVQTGLLRDLEDTALMIHGIGPDRISDMTINVLRGPLIKYTQDACLYYDIPMENDVDSGRMWNPVERRWVSGFVQRPVVEGLPLLLTPKVAVRARVSFDVDEYYRHYLLTHLQQEEMNTNSALVHTLKDGRKRVYKTELMEKYGSGKLAVADITHQHPGVLEQYREAKLAQSRPPLSHRSLAEAEGENEGEPPWQELLDAITELETGNAAATRYEDAIEALLTALFYPSLANPAKQVNIHNGLKRIDLTYDNVARRGFFSWVAQHYSAPKIFVECKNYSKEVSNPELDQLSGRFSDRRGRVGILVCRQFDNKPRFMTRCRSTADDGRGYVIALDDEDLMTLVRDVQRSGTTYPLLRDRFENLIL